MCLSAFVSNSLSLLLFTLQKYIQYSLHHQWCKKIKVTIHPRKIHMFHPKKGTVPYSNRKSHLPFQTSHFLGLGSKNPRPFIFQPKKILHSDETTKRTHRFPEAKATRKVSPTPRYTFWRKGKACQVQMARVHVGKPPWKPPSTWAFLQGSRIRYGGGTHGNGIHTPEPSKGDRKTEWISEEMGKAMRCFTFWGGGRRERKFNFFVWFLVILVIFGWFPQKNRNGWHVCVFGEYESDAVFPIICCWTSSHQPLKCLSIGFLYMICYLLLSFGLMFNSLNNRHFSSNPQNTQTTNK